MSLKRVIIYGGRGALGSNCVKAFKSQKWWVGSVDMQANDEADACIVVKSSDNYIQQRDSIAANIKDVLGENKLDALICVAGGWAGGNAASSEFLENSDLMWKQSVWSSSIAASLAASFLKDGGLLTLPGAHAALEGTPGMIGYGMAKAAVHQLTKSLAKKGSGLPANSKVYAILPVTLDTPNNRKWMPKADTSTWTPLEFISELFLKWAGGTDTPTSGSLVSLITKNNVTTLKLDSENE